MMAVAVVMGWERVPMELPATHQAEDAFQDEDEDEKPGGMERN